MVLPNVDNIKGRLYCEEHGLVTCLICLHSINCGDRGFTPDPHSNERFPCQRSAHRVQPSFKRFYLTPELLGFRGGLSPEDRRNLKARANTSESQDIIHNPGTDCTKCGLTYLSGGGSALTKCPSHIMPNGQRYIIVQVEPYKYWRRHEKIECSAVFRFFGPKPELNPEWTQNPVWTCKSKSDFGTADWNLDNVEIAVLRQLFFFVEKIIIPYRRKLVHDVVYTNSSYFTGQAWRFQLVVATKLRPSVLDFLLRADELKYSPKRKAFVERNRLGFVTKKYPVTEERRYQTVHFIRCIKHLASEWGIRIHWISIPLTDENEAARAAFSNQPLVFPPAQSGALLDDQEHEEVKPNEMQDKVEDDLLEGDSLDYLPNHDGYEAVEALFNYQNCRKSFCH